MLSIVSLGEVRKPRQQGPCISLEIKGLGKEVVLLKDKELDHAPDFWSFDAPLQDPPENYQSSTNCTNNRTP